MESAVTFESIALKVLLDEKIRGSASGVGTAPQGSIRMYLLL